MDPKNHILSRRGGCKNRIPIIIGPWWKTLQHLPESLFKGTSMALYGSDLPMRFACAGRAHRSVPVEAVQEEITLHGSTWIVEGIIRSSEDLDPETQVETTKFQGTFPFGASVEIFRCPKAKRNDHMVAGTEVQNM